jgi:hypothetical protein
MPSLHWFGRTQVDRNTWYEAESVRRLWLDDLSSLPFWTIGTAKAETVSLLLLDETRAPAERTLTYARDELTEKDGWSHQLRQAYVFSQPAEPIGAGAMPLTNAALWIASQGGVLKITDESETELTAAFEVLIDRLVNDGAMLIGRNPETDLDENLHASNLTGLAIRYSDTVLVPPRLLSDDELNELSETDAARWREAESRGQFWRRQERLQPGGELEFIECAFSPESNIWGAGENDKLFRAGKGMPLRTHIRVSQEFVRTRWPFHLQRTGAPKKTVGDDTYAGYQRRTKKDTGAWSSGEQDESWAKDGGYSVESVRDARKRFKTGLNAVELKEFEKPGPRKRKTD